MVIGVSVIVFITRFRKREKPATVKAEPEFAMA
jgi:hypothetical protein